MRTDDLRTNLGVVIALLGVGVRKFDRAFVADLVELIKRLDERKS